ncbi:MAG: hypothetical protein ACI978_002355 [Oleispira sp.]|jgi:hypothetical protein
MNAFLRFSIAATAIAVSSAHAGVVSTFIPAEPSIESPADNATEVSQTPRLESSLPLATYNQTTTNVDVTQIQTDWLLYAPDTNIILFGGAESSSQPGIITAESTKTVKLPFSISVYGDEVTTMKVSQAGDLTFTNDSGLILAEMTARIDNRNYTESSNTHSLAVIKFSPMQVLVQWYHKSNDAAPNVWQSDIQALATIFGTFGLRFSEHNINHDIFNLTTGDVGCHLRTSESSLQGRFEPLSFWKTSPIVSNNEFSIACVSKDIIDHTVTVTSFEDAAPTMFELPEINVISSTEIDYPLSSDQKLEANTEYALQARHHLKETSDVSASPVVNTSAFGEAISFTTEGTDLQLDASFSNSLSFVVDQTKDFTLTITNNNTEVAHPTAQIILPFDFLKSTTGTFNASVDGGTCTVALTSGQTMFNCVIPTLAAGASVTINAKASLPNTDITQIQYKVCETAFCSAKSLTSVAVTVDAAATSTAASSGSSGGGGFLLWIFAALPLLRRRSA